MRRKVKKCIKGRMVVGVFRTGHRVRALAFRAIFIGVINLKKNVTEVRKTEQNFGFSLKYL